MKIDPLFDKLNRITYLGHIIRTTVYLVYFNFLPVQWTQRYIIPAKTIYYCEFACYIWSVYYFCIILGFYFISMTQQFSLFVRKQKVRFFTIFSWFTLYDCQHQLLELFQLLFSIEHYSNTSINPQKRKNSLQILWLRCRLESLYRRNVNI